MKLHTIIFLCFIVYGMINPIRGEEPKTLPIGAIAPDFSLPGIDGRIYSLEDFHDSAVLVIIFTANHCPTAQAYEQKILDLYYDFAPKGAAFVLVSPNSPDALCLEELGYSDLGDSFEEMKIRAAERNFPMPYLFDGEKQEMSRKYGPTATPHVFIFDSFRKLRYTGRIDDTENPYIKPNREDAREALQALLEGKPVPVEKTKTFGCSIKWAEKAEWRKKLDAEWEAKPVVLKDISAEEIRQLLQNKTDRYLLVNVWATWCGPCIVELPELIKIQRMYGNRNFALVTISADAIKNKPQVLAFLKNKHIAVNNYIYNGSDKYILMDAIDKNWSGALPYILFIEPGGEVIYAYQGAIDPLQIKKLIISKLGRYYADDNK